MFNPNIGTIYDAMRRVPPVRRESGKFGNAIQPQTPMMTQIQPRIGAPVVSNADPNIHPALLGAMTRPIGPGY